MAKQKMKTVDMSVNPEDLDKLLETPSTEPSAITEEVEEVKKSAKKIHIRSKKYQAARSLVDRTKTYDLNQAIELVKKTCYAKFTATVVADLVLRDQKVSAEITFPFSTGKTVKVAIASDEVLADIEAGKLDFDILVTHPSFMPKLAKFARTLGPKGLMPNPKNGTITPDPDKRAKELAGGKTTVRPEKKAPLMHIIIGKVDQPTKELIANTETLVKALGAGKVTKLTLAASMSPGVKVDLSKLTA